MPLSPEGEWVPLLWQSFESVAVPEWQLWLSQSGRLDDGLKLNEVLTSGDVVFVSIKLGVLRRGTIENLLRTAKLIFGDGNRPIGVDVEDG